MPGHDPVWRDGEDIQVLENALRDTPLPADTRKAMLKRASTTLLATGGLGALLAACGAGAKASTQSTSKSQTTTTSSSGAEIQKIIDTAATAEALAVTYLSAVVSSKGVAGTPVGKFLPVLKAANAEEYAHYRVLTGLGAKPITTRFWAPHDFFGPNLSGVFPTLQVAETLFVNAYLIAMTTFARAGKTSLVRYASEIAGTEAQHLALARYAAGKLPNDVGFMDYSITSIDGIVSALEGAGVGFGVKGSKPGTFVNFSPPPASTVTHVSHTSPQ